jgi:hypothetical protein
MSRLFFVSICSCCLVTLSFAQSECGTSSGGSVSQGRYVNERIGLSYEFPGWLDPGDPKSYPKDPKGRPTAILLALWKTPRDEDKPVLIIMSDDPFQYRDSSALAYKRRIANTVAQQHATIFQTGHQYRISGFTFYRLDYEFPEISPKNLNVALTGRVGRCELSFELSASTQDEIDKVFRSISETTSIKPPPRQNSAH